MKRLLLLLSATALLVAAPAFAQYVFIDVDHDGDCDVNDVLNDTVLSIDIWIDTNHNKNGTTVTCSDGVHELDINGYEFILHCKTSDVTFGTYTNAVTEFTTQTAAPASNGTDYHVGYGTQTYLGTGPRKLGSLAITVAAGTNPVIAPVPEAGEDLDPNGDFYTLFGTQCPSAAFEASFLLGPRLRGITTTDFTDACGPGAPTPVRATTWGAIKKIYK